VGEQAKSNACYLSSKRQEPYNTRAVHLVVYSCPHPLGPHGLSWATLGRAMISDDIASSGSAQVLPLQFAFILDVKVEAPISTISSLILSAKKKQSKERHVSETHVW